MKKGLILSICLGFLITPVFIWAQNQFADPCLVRVYHTDFMLPPEGGVIVRGSDGLYFARTYLPGCEHSADGLVPIAGGVVAGTNTTVGNTATFVAPQTGTDSTNTGNGIINFFLGDSCLVPVYHSDFNFPPEGGAVIQNGDRLYFVPTYLPGCADAVNAGTVVKTAGQPNAPIIQPTGTGGGKFLNFLLGDPCLVPIYHANFNFPPEGGKITQIGNQLYFVKTYQSGCEGR